MRRDFIVKLVMASSGTLPCCHRACGALCVFWCGIPAHLHVIDRAWLMQVCCVIISSAARVLPFSQPKERINNFNDLLVCCVFDER